jgi:hypothetical protein
MTPPRVILDTNVLVSALLFEGRLAPLVDLWKKQTFIFLLTPSILDEYLRVLAYPKFQLSEEEIKIILAEELSPYVELIKERKIKVPVLSDSDDEIFLAAACLGNADYLVTGDKVLLQLKRLKQCEILKPSEFLEEFKSKL